MDQLSGALHWINGQITKRKSIRKALLTIEQSVKTEDFNAIDEAIYDALVKYPDHKLESHPRFIKSQRYSWELRREARKQNIKNIEEVIRKSSGSQREEALEALIKIDPQNQEFAGEIEDYKKSLYEASMVKLNKSRREDAIKAQFSSRSGSHLSLEKEIKESMHNPNSYEHIETKYWDMGDHLIIITKFRGSNAFGGIVSQFVKAKVSIRGGVIEIFERGT